MVNISVYYKETGSYAMAETSTRQLICVILRFYAIYRDFDIPIAIHRSLAVLCLALLLDPEVRYVCTISKEIIHKKPPSIQNEKATINIQKKNDKCFTYRDRVLDPNPEKIKLERITNHLKEVCKNLGLED